MTIRGVNIALAALVVCGWPAAPGFAQSTAFSDQTASAGINFTTSVPIEVAGQPHWPGGTVGDFNRDGWPDVFLLGGSGVVDALYMNNGDGTFTDRAATWGVNLLHRGHGATCGDYNNDGWLDIYITSSGDMSGNDRRGQHILYENNGNGTFANVAGAAGVNDTSADVITTSPAFGDYDLDGDLDLIVCQWANGNMGNRLFRNNGNGTFTDSTDTAGILQGDTRCFAPRFVDMDGDRYPELIMVSDFSTSVYYINDTDGTFTDGTAASGTGLETNGMGITTADFNRDGLMDYYATSIYRDSGGARNGNFVYINQGSHFFSELLEADGAKNGGWSWGAEALDFNNDGWQDIAVTNGWFQSEFQLEPTYLFRNNGDLTFNEVHAAAGLVSTHEGRSIMRLDYNRDGDMDLLIVSINAPVQLFRNDLSGPGTNWIEIKFDTSQTAGLAPDGIGSRVQVTTGGVHQYDYVSRGTTFLGGSEMLTHFGLGTATSIDQILVTWVDGATTTLTNIAANQTITISPSISGAPGVASTQGITADQLQARYNRFTGQVEIDYAPACNASNHTIYYGDLASVSSYNYAGAACFRGMSGRAMFDPGAGSSFFIVVGNTGVIEGSYGTDSASAERPEDTATAGCDLAQDLSAVCIP